MPEIWLVAHYIEGRRHYWHPLGFNEDPNEAVRFCRKEDAIAIIVNLLKGQGIPMVPRWAPPSLAA